MSKVTSKLQVTIPKRIADEHSIEPGDEIFFESDGAALRVRLQGPANEHAFGGVEWRLDQFDEMVRRQSERNVRVLATLEDADAGRGWSREELYDRGLPG